MLADGPPRLLVVDDNRLVRELVRDTFVEAGFVASAAANGREALDMMAVSKPDVVVTDVAMPELDGWGLCEAIKGDPDLRDVPVVFLSALRDVPDRVRGLRLGAHDYICKPFAPEELLVRVKGILERTFSPAVAGASASRSVLSGHTSHLATTDLVQLLAVNRKSGCLRLKGDDTGRIFFRDGQIVAAMTSRGAMAKKAVFRMLGWTDAEFEFDPNDDPNLVAADIGQSSQRLLMDALVAIDDLQRLRASLPPDAVRLQLAEGAMQLFAVANELTMTEREVLRAASEQCTMSEMLELGEGTDLDIARAVARLLEKGAIAPAG